MQNPITSDSVQQKDDSGRIMSNAIVLFVRMLLLTIISLYTVRIVVGGLGEIDYGIYSTIIGVITTSAFINTALAQSTQRFYSFHIGKQEYDMLSEVFSASMDIILILALLILITFEVLGVWLITNHLTIPSERLAASLTLFHFALFSFIFALLQIPFTAAIFSHEDMGIFALISTIDSLAKLVVACLMIRSRADHLVIYGILLFVVSVFVFSIYALVCRHRYKECRYRRIRNRQAYKDLMSFSSWTFLGSISNAGMIQGNMIILNIFFGPLANAAYGIAIQINNAFTSLYNCIILAFRPAIVKTYARNNAQHLCRLFYISNKCLAYTIMAIAIPLIIEMRWVLKVWLGNVSEATVLFSRLMIVYLFCMAMNGPITTVIQATGRIKQYHLSVEGIILMCVPISWFLSSQHYPQWNVLCTMICVCIIAHGIRLVCLRRSIAILSIRRYLLHLCIPTVLVGMLASFLCWQLHHAFSQDPWGIILKLTIGPLTVLVLALTIGTDQEERKEIIDVVTLKSKLFR